MTVDQVRYKKGIELFEQLAPEAFKEMQAGIGRLSPDLLDYVVEFPFGEIYSRSGLPKRERQLVTLACLATRGDAAPQLNVHFAVALKLGISKEELVELILQLVPYAGFPTAINAAGSLSEVLNAREQEHNGDLS